jgi:Glyoxalase/Bleomycin resistance protein/Dioxygenase superfamily
MTSASWLAVLHTDLGFVYSFSVPAIHHFGYVVEDLQAGAQHFASAFGAGPFFGMEHLEFDEVSYLGQPAVYDHSSAFGQCGPILIEISVVHDAQPRGLRDALVKPGEGVGHVAWLTDSLPDEVSRLTAAGHTPFHAGRTGPASAVWFEGGPVVGHPIEVLQRRDELLHFYEMVRSASEGWDGSDPLRILTGPPE